MNFKLIHNLILNITLENMKLHCLFDMQNMFFILFLFGTNKSIYLMSHKIEMNREQILSNERSCFYKNLEKKSTNLKLL
jgi:hypothetical protein